MFALRLIAARVGRELSRRPLRGLLVMGTAAIVFTWALGGHANWAGMLTALIGLAASGGLVWAVRLIGTAALRREAMGFGDVTLMMMIGTFLGWQACIILFFLSPFAALVDRSRCNSCLRRDDVIPYGPFLCLAAAAGRRLVGADLELGPTDVRPGLAGAGRAGRVPGAAGRDAGRLAGDQNGPLRPRARDATVSKI